MIEDIVEVMARAIAEASDEYPDLWRLYEKQSEIALAALDEAGYAVVKKDSPNAIWALERLASMEAFTIARFSDPDRDAELLARIDFASRVLSQLKGETR